MVRSEIIEEVKDSEVLSIMADETKDILKKSRFLSHSGTITMGPLRRVFSILNLQRG